MKRLEAIKKIMSNMDDELVITTTGMISREVFWIKDRPQNFYMCGSMGCALPVGLGLAMNTDKKVVVIDGDGAALMGLSAMVLANAAKPKNLRYLILDNGAYDSTGGQPTCSDAVDFRMLFDVEVIKVEPGSDPKTPRISVDPVKMLARFIGAVQEEK